MNQRQNDCCCRWRWSRWWWWWLWGVVLYVRVPPHRNRHWPSAVLDQGRTKFIFIVTSFWCYSLARLVRGKFNKIVLYFGSFFMWRGFYLLACKEGDVTSLSILTEKLLFLFHRQIEGTHKKHHFADLLKHKEFLWSESNLNSLVDFFAVLEKIISSLFLVELK